MSVGYSRKNKESRKSSTPYEKYVRRRIKRGVLPAFHFATVDDPSAPIHMELRRDPKRTRKNRVSPVMVKVQSNSRMERDKYGFLTWRSKNTYKELTKEETNETDSQ